MKSNIKFGTFVLMISCLMSVLACGPSKGESDEKWIDEIKDGVPLNESQITAAVKLVKSVDHANMAEAECKRKGMGEKVGRRESTSSAPQGQEEGRREEKGQMQKEPEGTDAGNLKKCIENFTREIKKADFAEKLVKDVEKSKMDRKSFYTFVKKLVEESKKKPFHFDTESGKFFKAIFKCAESNFGTDRGSCIENGPLGESYGNKAQGGQKRGFEERGPEQKGKFREESGEMEREGSFEKGFGEEKFYSDAPRFNLEQEKRNSFNFEKGFGEKEFFKNAPSSSFGQQENNNIGQNLEKKSNDEDYSSDNK